LTYLFIVNPVAGNNSGKQSILIIQEVMERNIFEYSIKETTKPGDAKVFSKEAAESSIDVIVAVGGDGTVNEVFNGMIGSNKILGIVPAGTGNDLSRSLHIPLAIEDALEFIVNGDYISIDVGKINGQLFINVASVGLDAIIAEEANKIKKVISGKYSYILALLKGLIYFKSKKIKIKIDDENEFEKDIMLVAISNGICYGGGMRIAPNAQINDGLFDICIVKKMSKFKLLYLFPSIYKGDHVKFDEVEILRGERIDISSNEDLIINIDGEVIYHKPISFRILKNAIRVIGKIK